MNMAKEVDTRKTVKVFPDLWKQSPNFIYLEFRGVYWGSLSRRVIWLDLQFRNSDDCVQSDLRAGKGRLTSEEVTSRVQLILEKKVAQRVVMRMQRRTAYGSHDRVKKLRARWIMGYRLGRGCGEKRRSRECHLISTLEEFWNFSGRLSLLYLLAQLFRAPRVWRSCLPEDTMETASHSHLFLGNHVLGIHVLILSGVFGRLWSPWGWKPSCSCFLWHRHALLERFRCLSPGGTPKRCCSLVIDAILKLFFFFFQRPDRTLSVRWQQAYYSGQGRLHWQCGMTLGHCPQGEIQTGHSVERLSLAVWIHWSRNAILTF